jgi:SAM-dependent methyltransferase
VRLLAPARRLRFELVAAGLEEYAAGRPLRVLDAGCGEGIFAVSLARRHPGWTVVGADRSDELLERGRVAAARERLANLELVHADLTGDLGSEAYDAVAAIECLEEIPQDTQALRRMIAALRPGGLFVAHLPQREWKPVLRGSEPTWKHEVRHGYDAAELSTRLAALGLRDVSVDGTSRGLVRLAQELRDRASTRSIVLRAALAPLLVGAVPLERSGVTWGSARALIVRARRPAASDRVGE